MRLSLLIPIYNEVTTIAVIVEKILSSLPHIDKELVLVDDGSTDGTRELLENLFGPATRELSRGAGDPSGPLPRQYGENCVVQLAFLAGNRGKGGAVRHAMDICSGDIVVIQDADLEYDPADLAPMYELIASRGVADVVYGSRFYGKAHRSLYYHHYLGNRLISILFNVLYNQTLTDIEVCYKMFTRDVLRTLDLTCKDFGMEVQISAQIALMRRWRVYELGIHYFGRTYQEGKKIDWRDGVKALWYLVLFRVRPGTRSP